MSEVLGYEVTGQETIHCEACEQRISKALRRLPGVQNVEASSSTQRVQVTIDPAQVGADGVKSKLEQIGYHVTPDETSP